ncbi:MAG: 2,3-bisphosphoglycerate-independent phosphoglycerate mutase [Deltaproteobacteria bacterium]
MQDIRPVCLIVMDGWGVRSDRDANATMLASTPVLTRLQKEYPSTTLDCSGLSVGLPAGQMGNSEVGHLTMGAGRVVYQELTRISKEIEEGDFRKNPVLNGLLSDAAKTGASVHLMGLVSDGGVHSHITHLYALLDCAKASGVKNVFVHAFLDGRDTPPKSGIGYVTALQSYMDKITTGHVATVSGRYYAMDRDNRWERIKKAYDALAMGRGIKAYTAEDAVEQAYRRGETDEFISPTVIVDMDRPVATVDDADNIIFFNFRADRARELARAFTDDGFKEFEREKTPGLRNFLCFTEYDASLKLPALFRQQNLKNILAEVLSGNNIAQFRVSETEKYAHVTYFFNGGREQPFPGEERLLIPSVKHVPTYDLYPQMRAEEIADAAARKIREGHVKFVLLNLANGDMVGHTGVLGAALKAAEAVDKAVGVVVEEALKMGFAVLLTSDHGNLEQMTDPSTKSPYTAHTLNRVPFILVDDTRKGASLRQDGGLQDIAQTVLKIMGIERPAEMRGEPLF